MTEITAPAISPECEDGSVELKMSKGGINAYYHTCDVYQGRSNYAVCLHTIDAVRDRRVQLRSSCQEAIERGTCPAIAMRKQEEEAGHALFFIDRAAQLERFKKDYVQPSAIRYGKGGRTSQPFKTTRVSADEAREQQREWKSAKSAPKKESTEINVELMGNNLLGDAIERMMEEAK